MWKCVQISGGSIMTPRKFRLHSSFSFRPHSSSIVPKVAWGATDRNTDECSMLFQGVPWYSRTCIKLYTAYTTKPKQYNMTQYEHYFE